MCCVAASVAKVLAASLGSSIRNDSMSDRSKGLRRRNTRQGNAVIRIHYSADPERGQAWVAQERKRYSSQGAWDREQEIIHEAGGGERLFADVLNRWGDKIII